MTAAERVVRYLTVFGTMTCRDGWEISTSYLPGAIRNVRNDPEMPNIASIWEKDYNKYGEEVTYLRYFIPKDTDHIREGQFTEIEIPIAVLDDEHYIEAVAIQDDLRARGILRDNSKPRWVEPEIYFKDSGEQLTLI